MNNNNEINDFKVFIVNKKTKKLIFEGQSISNKEIISNINEAIDNTIDDKCE